MGDLTQFVLLAEVVLGVAAALTFLGVVFACFNGYLYSHPRVSVIVYTTVVVVFAIAALIDSASRGNSNALGWAILMVFVALSVVRSMWLFLFDNAQPGS
jgi:hypothetical protein